MFPFLEFHLNNLFFLIVCKFKAHKRCAARASSNCKWTTLAAIGRDIMEDEDGVGKHFHLYTGNIPMNNITHP